MEETDPPLHDKEKGEGGLRGPERPDPHTCSSRSTPRNTCPHTPLRGQNLQPSHGPPSPSGCGLEMHPKTSVHPSSPREMDKRPDGEGGWAPCTHLREPPITRLPGGALTHLQLPAPQNLPVNGASPRQPGTRYPGQGGGAAAGRLAQARTLRPRCRWGLRPGGSAQARTLRPSCGWGGGPGARRCAPPTPGGGRQAGDSDRSSESGVGSPAPGLALPRRPWGPAGLAGTRGRGRRRRHWQPGGSGVEGRGQLARLWNESTALGICAH